MRVLSLRSAPVMSTGFRAEAKDGNTEVMAASVSGVKVAMGIS